MGEAVGILGSERKVMDIKHRWQTAVGQVQRCFFNCDRKQVSNYISSLLPCGTRGNERVSTILLPAMKIFRGGFSFVFRQFVVVLCRSLVSESNDEIKNEPVVVWKLKRQ